MTTPTCANTFWGLLGICCFFFLFFLRWIIWKNIIKLYLFQQLPVRKLDVITQVHGRKIFLTRVRRIIVIKKQCSILTQYVFLGTFSLPHWPKFRSNVTVAYNCVRATLQLYYINVLHIKINFQLSLISNVSVKVHLNSLSRFICLPKSITNQELIGQSTIISA